MIPNLPGARANASRLRAFPLYHHHCTRRNRVSPYQTFSAPAMEEEASFFERERDKLTAEIVSVSTAARGRLPCLSH